MSQKKLENIMIIHRLLEPQMANLAKDFNVLRADLADDFDDFIAKNGADCRVAITTGHIVFDEKIIEKMPNLELVGCFSVGYDQINIDDLKKHKIKLVNTPDVLTDDVADTALMLMLATRRQLIKGDHYVRSNQWSEKGSMALTKTTTGQKAGIVGLGRIGQAIAKRFAACSCEIGYFGRSQKTDISYQYFNNLLEMAAWADILVVAVVGGAETEKMISKQVIEALGSEGSLINIARGTVIDELAMIEALKNGTLGSAGLDVFLNEPHINKEFYALDNVVLYPHHASATSATRNKMSELVVENILAFYANKPLITEVF